MKVKMKGPGGGVIEVLPQFVEQYKKNGFREDKPATRKATKVEEKSDGS